MAYFQSNWIQVKMAVKNEQMNERSQTDSCDSVNHRPAAAHNHRWDISEPIWSISYFFYRNSSKQSSWESPLPVKCWRTILLVWWQKCGSSKLKQRLDSRVTSQFEMAGDACFDAPSSDPFQLHIIQPFHPYLCASVSSLHRQLTLLSNKLCTYLCVRSISQPPAGLGAGCYLAGKLGFGAAVWVSGRSEKGSSISGAEPPLENRDISAWESDFILHSAWDSQRYRWGKKIGSGGRKGHRKLWCSLRPLGGHRQLHSGGGAAGCQSKVSMQL